MKVCSSWSALVQMDFGPAHVVTYGAFLAPYPVSMGCRSSIINYLTSTFFLREIRLISQLKSYWSKPKKAIITVTSRIYCFWLSLKDIFFTQATCRKWRLAVKLIHDAPSHRNNSDSEQVINRLESLCSTTKGR